MNRALLTTALIALLGSANTFEGDTAAELMQASTDRDSALVSHLLAYGAHFDATDDHGNTALMAAAAHGYADITASLVDSGANVNAAGRLGNTALVYAAQVGNINETAGDGFMAIFLNDDDTEHPVAAVHTALRLLQSTERLNAEQPETPLAIHTR